MTRKQIEKFALGYPVPTDWVAVLLGKYNYDKDKVHEILCKGEGRNSHRNKRRFVLKMIVLCGDNIVGEGSGYYGQKYL